MATTEKNFTDSDISGADSQFPRIYCDKSELVYDPPEWMRRGLQQTASGYGSKLNSGMKIRFNGKLYRIYVTIWSNSGSSWFITKGRRIYVD